MMLKRTLTAAVAMLAIVFAAPALAQQAPANVHGHVSNPIGVAVTGAQVKFTTDKTSEAKDRKYSVSVDTDANGNYKATVPPGDYLMVVFQGTVSADFQTVTFKAGDDKTVDFDMTREEYIKAMTPEQRQQIEEYKKKNSAATSANAVIAKLNATLGQVRADLAKAAPTKADVSADVTQMKQAVDAKGDTGLLWVVYGDTLLAQADHLVAEDKKAGKPSLSDDDVIKTYGDASAAYKKAIDLDSAGAKPNLPEVAAAYNQMGTALSRSGKTSEATTAFENAAKAEPARAGMYYKNEAVVDYGGKDANPTLGDAAVAAADKAIAANPSDPTPYYIKGQVLIGKSSFDNKTQKLTPPPGCIEAYQKFLELAPDDPKAAEVRSVLSSLGEKIDTKFKAGKK